MEENKERKGLFLSGIIVGFAATLLIVGGIFIAFQIHNIVSLKDDVSAQVSMTRILPSMPRQSKNCSCWRTR